ncbi:hypothetical protein PUMCH_004523 [Australozyma saopauloensis]|uniref:Zn(2)-C6 fungal-type domain-containing protein n=1 Tax=Australozyma saopauloensis TaxID=291208 RepID=A0AAX4HFJ3_9ASCO|nr:hypothetical protein PUMCH_004523 [[Candida] saopauloensis]
MTSRGAYCSLSCLNCRSKKRKCDGGEICNYCRRLNLECRRTSKDHRSDRLTTSEAHQLQESASRLKLLVAQIGEIANENDDRGIEKIRMLLRKAQTPNKIQKTTRKIPVSIGASSGGGFSVFGPTSAFHNLVDMSSGPQSEELNNGDLYNTAELKVCVINFFKWLYPDITVFIHRESFLNDFLIPSQGQKYCSKELVYAIAALGARCTDDESQRTLSQSFYETARAEIFSKKVCEPQITTLQALLCLSLYELGDGNASASWMLSGMAIRMGYDLGFQLNPSDWAIADSGGDSTSQQGIIANLDIMIRSRIYWGCYILDHFISLIMGRPVTVRKTEASIPSSEMLPNAENIDEYVFLCENTSHSVGNLDAALTIEPLCSLGECVGSLLADIFSAYTADENLSYLNKIKVAKYNTALADWRRKLPLALRWTKTSMLTCQYNPTVMNYRLFYYVVLICLNRPFLGLDPSEFPGQPPLKICSDAIAELAGALEQFNQASYPLSILVVYSSILALSVLIAQVQNLPPNEKPDEVKLQQLRVYLKTVSGSSSRWKLAARSVLFFKNKVAALQNAAMSEIFAAEDEKSNILTQIDFDQVLEMGEDMFLWGNQDNLLNNFFEFFDHSTEMGSIK